MVVSYNVRELLAKCLESVLCHAERSEASVIPGAAQNDKVWEVFVVDNASSDGSAEMVRERFPHVRLIANERNAGFGAANNQALRVSRGRYVLILNPDTEILSGSLDRMVEYMVTHSDVAVLGVRLLYPDGSFQHSCFRFPGLAQAFLDLYPIHPRLMESRLNGRYPRRAYDHEMDVDHPLGACFMLRRAAGLEFDEAYFMYSEEIDLCWRARQAGWKVRYLPELTVLHHAGASTRQRSAAMREQLYRSRRLFNRRYHGPLFNAAWEAIVWSALRWHP